MHIEDVFIAQCWGDHLFNGKHLTQRIRAHREVLVA